MQTIKIADLHIDEFMAMFGGLEPADRLLLDDRYEWAGCYPLARQEEGGGAWCIIGRVGGEGDPQIRYEVIDALVAVERDEGEDEDEDEPDVACALVRYHLVGAPCEACGRYLR